MFLSQSFPVRILIIFLYTNALFSQIRATVIDSLTNEPIPYVNIWVENEDNSALPMNLVFLTLVKYMVKKG